MDDKIKLTKEELEEIIKLRADISNLFVQLGELHLRKKEAMDEFDKKETEILSDRETLGERESELFNRISEKYGQGNVNLETGIFTPVTEENKED